MTDDTLHRLMKVQLEKARKTINSFLYDPTTGLKELKELEHEIGDCLAIVEADSKYVKTD